MVLQATAANRRPRQALYAHFRPGHGTAPAQHWALPWAPGAWWLHRLAAESAQKAKLEIADEEMAQQSTWTSACRAGSTPEIPQLRESLWTGWTSPWQLGLITNPSLQASTWDPRFWYKANKHEVFLFQTIGWAEVVCSSAGQIHINSKSEINMESDS